MRICIVDDNEAVLESLKLVLSDSGHEIFTADNAGAALELLDGAQADFVVTDLNLPGMSGLALAAEIRMRYPNMPIILTSGARSPLDKNAGRLIDGFLSKPFTPSALIAALAGVQTERQAA